MGTYGVTHLKKDDKIIPFSDSYDGYWSGMGMANLLGLKLINLEKLNQLFDKFSARKALNLDEISNFKIDNYDDSEFAISQRQIQEFISSIKDDTKNNKEALDWANDLIKGDIRTSSVGVIPLLYMNIHPHYGYDYDYCDYEINLNKKVFIFSNFGLEIPFELIQKSSIEHIMYFFENDTSLIDLSQFPEIGEDGLENYLYENENNKNDSILFANKFVKYLFELPQELVNNYFNKKEQERLKWVEEANKQDSNLKRQYNNDDNDDNDDDNQFHSYSIYTSDLSAEQLRKAIFFLQQQSLKPGYEFILSNIEWGLDENYINGGIRLMTPKDKNLQEKFNEIIQILEYEFKFKFNIFSSSGNLIGGIFGNEENITIQKSIYNFDELKTLLTKDDFSLVMEQGLPYLFYHSYFSESSNYLISNNGKTSSPVFWIFVSLLSQNEKLFNLIYENSKLQLLDLKANDVKRIKKIYLSSFYDGEHLKNLLKNENEFFTFLKQSTFFKDCQSILSEHEKKKFIKNKRFNT